MAYTKGSKEAFTGGSGQMAVMGELLHRECNAALPIIDIGMDVFAFRDDREEVARIQDKTATAKRYKKADGYVADFRLPTDQLRRINTPPLYYALAVRLESGWGGIVVINRAILQELRENGCGSEIRDPTGKSELKLYIKFRTGAVAGEQRLTAFCGDIDLSQYVNAWESLPPLKPPVPIGLPPEGVVPAELAGDQS